MYMLMDVLSIFAKIVVYSHSHIFNMVSKFAANCHVTILLLLLQIKVKVSQLYVEWFWGYSVLNPYTLSFQESLKHAWH